MKEALAEMISELAELESDLGQFREVVKGDNAKARMALRAAILELWKAAGEFKGEHNLTRDDLAFCALYSMLYQISKGETVYGGECQFMATRLLRALAAAEPEEGAPKMPRFLARKHDASFPF